MSRKQAQHTPGPWALLRQGYEIQGDGGHEIMVNIDGIPVSICEIPVESVNSTSSHRRKYREDKNESLANGRLIAAAPALLDAMLELQHLANFDKDGSLFFCEEADAMGIINAAVALATGKK